MYTHVYVVYLTYMCVCVHEDTVHSKTHVYIHQLHMLAHCGIQHLCEAFVRSVYITQFLKSQTQNFRSNLQFKTELNTKTKP